MNEGRKEWIRWVELDLLLHRGVQRNPQSMWSPGGRFLFFRGFLGGSCQSINSCWSTMALGRDHGLLFGTGVQLMVSYTTIEAQIVFETLLALVTGQLAIAGQLGRKVHLRSVRLLLGSGKQRWLRGRVLGGWGRQRWICLALGGHDRTRGGSFSLLLGVRLEGLFLHLPCMVAFVVSFPVAVINSHR